MRMCHETVTVFNARTDPDAGDVVYAPTVLRGVSWRGETVSAVTEGGLKAADRFALRIPGDVDAGGRTYAEPGDYAAAGDVSGLWTLRTGDVIVRGEVDDPGAPLAQLRQGREAMTVLGVADNRRAPNAPHWRVTGE